MGEGGKIYAGQLREAGFNIPESIPDCATVPSNALKFHISDHSCDVVQGVLSAEVAVEFTEPFEWVQVEVSVDRDDGGE
jgi:hypothetical protein